MWPFFREALLLQGLKPGVWFTDGRNLRLTPADAHFTIAEDESPADRQGAIDSIPLLDPAMPKAIVSNVWVVKKPDGVTDVPATLATAAPLVEAGFHMITETYIRNDSGYPTGVTPDSLAFIAEHHLGFPRSRIQPTFGIFGGATEQDYAQWKPAWPGWSDYVVENTLS